MRPLIIVLIVLAVALLAATGCGAGSSPIAQTQAPTTPKPITQPTTPTSTGSAAQGVYSGSTTAGTTLTAIVLPNDDFVALYGTESSNLFYVSGVLFGRGQSDHGTFTVDWIDDYSYTGTITKLSLAANYVIGSSLNGTLTGPGVAAISITSTTMPSSSFNYNTGALLSDITGDWSGTLFDGTPANITVNAYGAFTGSSSSGCSFSGTITPDASRNFFVVLFAFAGDPCSEPNTEAAGIGLDYLVAGTTSRQLLMAARTTSYYAGPAQTFVARRQ